MVSSSCSKKQRQFQLDGTQAHATAQCALTLSLITLNCVCILAVPGQLSKY